MISWDFSKLMMGFKFHDKQVWLNGLKVSKPLLQESTQFGKGVVAQGLLLQIMQCSPCLNQEVQNLVCKRYWKTFQGFLRNLKGYHLQGDMSIRFF